MVLSKKFQSQSEAIASFDFQDVADGTGNIIFYLYAADAGSTTYHLGTTTEIFSFIIDLDLNNGTLNFNASPFNTPRVVKGDAIINITLLADTAATITAQLQRISAGVATNIHTSAGKAAGITTGKYLCFNVSLTETLFKVGDNLRLVLTTTGESGTSQLGIDPANRAGASLTLTKSQVIVPFKIFA